MPARYVAYINTCGKTYANKNQSSQNKSFYNETTVQREEYFDSAKL